MTSGNVMQACKKRLAGHAASYLEIMDFYQNRIMCTPALTCLYRLRSEDVLLNEKCDEQSSLSTHKESYAAHVAGWIE